MKSNHTAAPFTNTLSANKNNKKSHGKSCPASLLNQPLFQYPPPLGVFCGGGGAFQKFLRVKIIILALIYMKTFFGRAYAENK